MRCDFWQAIGLYVLMIHDLQVEQQQIQMAKARSEDFAPLYNHYYDPIFRYVFRRTGDEHLTADLVGQVFFKALKSLKKYHVTDKPFIAWLYTIAGNEVKKHYRKKKEVYLIDESEIQMIKDDDEMQNIDLGGLRLALELMGENDLAIIELKYYEGYTFEEIAEIRAQKVSTVKMQLYRALERLKGLIK